MDLQTVLEILKTGSPFAPFLIFWWLERRERMEKDKKLEATLERTLVTLSAVAVSINSFAEILKVKGED